MKHRTLVSHIKLVALSILTAALMQTLVSCGKSEPDKSAGSTVSTPPATEQAVTQEAPSESTTQAEAPAQESMPTDTTSQSAPGEAVDTAGETTADSTATEETATVATSAPAKPEAVGQDDMLALARKSGCLACHSVDKKLVGPAWKDVSARYKGNAAARAQLIDKVSKGGRGNWTDVVGDVAMPPYHPRVSTENIEKLVDFVLGLAEG